MNTTQQIPNQRPLLHILRDLPAEIHWKMWGEDTTTADEDEFIDKLTKSANSPHDPVALGYEWEADDAGGLYRQDAIIPSVGTDSLMVITAAYEPHDDEEYGAPLFFMTAIIEPDDWGGGPAMDGDGVGIGEAELVEQIRNFADH